MATVVALSVTLLLLAAGLATGGPAGGALPAAAATHQAAPSFKTAATMSGPVTTGHMIEPLTGQPSELVADGYGEQEYFASGTATAFEATSMPSDGKWSVDAARLGAVHDEDPRAPAGRPGQVQRHGGRRVDERHGRRVGPRLGLPQSRC